MKRVLVTGGAGFIGSHLCERLVKEGNDVICLCLLYTSTTGNFLNQLVKTVAPSLGVLDKLPIGETVKGIIRPEEKDEKKDTTKK